MHRLLDVGLEQLTSMVYRMGEVSEKAIRLSIRGFVNQRDTTGDVRELSDILGTMTVEVENKSFELIVKFQPVASDLRIINSYMKIAYDFERYGRYAWDISFTHKRLTSVDDCVGSMPSITDFAETVMDMVSKSVHALRQHDAEMARSLAETEKEVDDMYFASLDALGNSQELNKCVMCNLLVARFLERIADHTTYVGESIVYIATGEKWSLR